MAASFLDRLGFGNGRAVANARQAVLQREEEERLVAELVQVIAQHQALAAPRKAG